MFPQIDISSSPLPDARGHMGTDLFSLPDGYQGKKKYSH